jgi:4-hydroxybenzoate polyprenyltransferase
MRENEVSVVRLLFAAMFFLAMFSVCVSAEPTDAERIDSLQSRVSNIERRTADYQDVGAVLWLFAAFCALWAQNTHRSAVLWFFMGLLFSVITVLVLLYKNAYEKEPQPQRNT